MHLVVVIFALGATLAAIFSEGSDGTDWTAPQAGSPWLGLLSWLAIAIPFAVLLWVCFRHSAFSGA